MLLLDLETVAPAERADVFHHAMTNESVPNRIVHLEPSAGMRARMELWDVGGLTLFSGRNSGFELHRTEAHTRRQRSEPVVSVSLQTRGVGRAESGGRQRLLGPDDIAVFHELVPRVYGWTGDGASRAVVLDVGRLGLPVDTVATAAGQLRASPLHDLVLRHLREMWRDPDRLAADPGAAALAAGTTDLVRALLVSAADDTRAPTVRAVLDETLLTRVLAYTRQHLADPGLTPERIAFAHGVSLRQLYALLRGGGVGLEQWIITERLAKAAAMLASARYDRLTVAAVARRCGWSDASHFGRRFRAAHGMSPGEWRRHGRDGG